MFQKATKKKAKLRLGIEGPSGSGKTMSALKIASGLGGPIAVVDTESGSASLYSDDYEFDVVELAPPFEPERFISCIHTAEQAGYNVLIIDSLSHEWEGEGGCLDIQNKLGGRWTDWAKVTPRHNALVNALLQSKLHIIVTMRSKTDYIIEKNSRGKDSPVKVGTAPKQRDGFEYELTCNFKLNQNHMAEAEKDRSRLFDGKNFHLSEETGHQLKEWLNNGVDLGELDKQAANDLAECADLGTTALKERWESLEPAQRKRLGAELINSLKVAAQEADDEANLQENVA